MKKLPLEKVKVKMTRENECENDKRKWTTCHLRKATGLVLPKSSASTPKEGGEFTTSYVNPAWWVLRLCSLRVYNWWNTNGKSHFLTDFLSLHSGRTILIVHLRQTCSRWWCRRQRQLYWREPQASRVSEEEKNSQISEWRLKQSITLRNLY